MTESRVEPCTQDMSGQGFHETCPACLHSAFLHMIEAEGCIFCYMRSINQETQVMLEELREIISGFTVSTRMNSPRPGNRRAKISKKRK